MNDFFSVSNNKSSKIIQVNNIYSEQGQDLESILKNAIKNILIGGKIPEKVFELKKQIVIEDRAKEDEF